MLAAHASYAQLGIKGSSKIDSLQLLADKLSGNQKVDMLNALAYEWFDYSDKMANEKIREALKLSEKLGYDKGRGEALIYKGIYERDLGNVSQAHNDFIVGIKLSKKAGNKRMEGYGLTQYGAALLLVGKKDSSLMLHKQSYAVLRDSLNPLELSILYRHLSKYYKVASDFRMEKEYLLRSSKIREALKGSAVLAAIYTELAAYYGQFNKIDEATLYLEKAERMISSLGDLGEARMADFKYAKAVILAKQSHYKEALAIFNELKEYRKGNASLQKQTNQLIEFGFLLAELGNYELSLFNYYEALKIAEENKYQHEHAKVLV